MQQAMYASKHEVLQQVLIAVSLAARCYMHNKQAVSGGVTISSCGGKLHSAYLYPLERESDYASPVALVVIFKDHELSYHVGAEHVCHLQLGRQVSSTPPVMEL